MKTQSTPYIPVKKNTCFFFKSPNNILNFFFSLSLYVPVEAAGGKALACVVDIRDEQQISEAVQKAVDKFGGTPNRRKLFKLCRAFQVPKL